jgi:hypothetical protein
MAEDTTKLLAERGKTHGEYRDHARATQGVMRVLSAEKNWSTLPDIMKETIHMIAHKLGRVVTGDPYVEDHWFDIEGYSRLVRERLGLVKADPDDIYTIFAKATGLPREEAKRQLLAAAYKGQPVLAAAEATVTASPASEASGEPLKAVQEPMAPLVPRRLSDDGTKHHVNAAPYSVTRDQFDMMGDPDKSAYKFAVKGGILCDHLTFAMWDKCSDAIQMWYDKVDDDTYIINRHMMKDDDIAQCMMYQPELNNSEFMRIPEGSWQRKLYAPVGEKMIMLPRFREHWAK